jgi:hypothetical protein
MLMKLFHLIPIYIEAADKSKWAKKLRKLFEESIKYKNENIENYDICELDIFREIQKFKKRLGILFRKSPPKQEEKRLYSQLIGRQKQLLLFLEKKEYLQLIMARSERCEIE